MPKIPSVSSKRFCKFLESVGCRLARTEGDHFIFVKDGLVRPVVVPMVKHLPIFVVLNNLKTLGVSRNRFLELLD